MKRMDRYQADEQQPSRTEKNQELYQNFSNNVIYTNVADVATANAYDITETSHTDHTYTTREAYQQMQRYQDIDNVPQSKKELNDFNYLYQKKENKVYDINSVLEAARKNRQEKDENESKRKLKNNAYNILSGMNKKELERYREEKKQRMMTPEEEEIRELIDTIASKTLAGEIDKATSVDLLSDLMATNMMDKVSASAELEVVSDSEEEAVPEKVAKEEERTEEIEETEETEEIATEEIEKNDLEEAEEDKEEETSDFYSKSMDLSEQDLDISDDFKESSLSLPLKIIIFLIITGIIALAIYFIYQRIQ